MPSVTLLVAPRERFSLAAPSLERLLAATTGPLRLVYVAAGLPARARDDVRRVIAAAEAGGIACDWVDPGRYLTPNEARNAGLARVTTPYVVFIDNDALVVPGWLEALVDCAEATGADVVGPLYLIGDLDAALTGDETIHMAGGRATVVDEDGRPILHDAHQLADTRLADERPRLVRQPCDYVEFHCMLVRRAIFERVGPLDEHLLSINEHVDFCLGVRAAGGTVWLEPSAIASYVPPPAACDWSDLPYFMLRWSDTWNVASARHFNRKHGVCGVRFVGDTSTLTEDTVVRFARGQRRLLSQLAVPADGTGPVTDIDQARQVLALFLCQDRERFDLLAFEADGERVIHARADARAILDRLPRVIDGDTGRPDTLALRPHQPERDDAPLLLRLDGLAVPIAERLAAHCFLVLETAPGRRQCWIALSPAARRSGLRFLAGAAAALPDVPLPSSQPTGARLVRADPGRINSVAELERAGAMRFLWGAAAC